MPAQTETGLAYGSGDLILNACRSEHRRSPTSSPMATSITVRDGASARHRGGSSPRLPFSDDRGGRVIARGRPLPLAGVVPRRGGSSLAGLLGYVTAVPADLGAEDEDFRPPASGVMNPKPYSSLNQ